jgi:hypothetical protein
MKRLLFIALIALPLPLAAQEAADSVQLLRSQIRQRWTAHVRSTLGLDDDQTAKLQATEQNFEGQRQPIRVRQREINRALSSELASGTPNQDRVKQLINERQENQLKLQQLNRDEDREIQGYLTPVQHARYQDERRRFQERVAEVVRQRREQRRQMPGPHGGAGKRPQH